MEDKNLAYLPFSSSAQLSSISSNPRILGIGTAQALGFYYALENKEGQ